MFHICIALTSSNGKVHKVCPRNMFVYGQASVAALQRHPGACSSARPEGVRGCRPPQPLITHDSYGLLIGGVGVPNTQQIAAMGEHSNHTGSKTNSAEPKSRQQGLVAQACQ